MTLDPDKVAAELRRLLADGPPVLAPDGVTEADVARIAVERWRLARLDELPTSSVEPPA